MSPHDCTAFSPQCEALLARHVWGARRYALDPMRLLPISLAPHHAGPVGLDGFGHVVGFPRSRVLSLSGAAHAA
ncbi:hypothetical protein ACHAWF_000855 [Thalassiosira exigua]